MLLDGLRRMIIRNILILTVIAALVPTTMLNVSASAAAEIALFSGVSDSDGLSISGNGDTAKMELKATNDNGKTNKVLDYQMNADNVLYIKVGDKVTVEDNVDFTKAITTDGNNNQKAIGITSNGVIDFTGYAQGVSTLDVVVDDDRAYEAIIVIGQHPPEVINKQVTKVNNNQETRVQFVYPDPPKCDEGEELIDGECRFCEYYENGECRPMPYPVEEPEPEPEEIDCSDPALATSVECITDEEDPCDIDPDSPECVEGIDCDKDPTACGVIYPEEELLEEEELTETTEIEEIEEEEEESGESEEVENEESEEE